MDRVAEILPRPEYFYQVNNSLIYATMLDMFTLGKPIDFVTVLEQLKPQRGLTRPGQDLPAAAGTTGAPISNVETYANIVRDKYDARTLIVTAREILEEAGSGEVPASTLLDSAEQRIFDIRRGKKYAGLQRIDEIILDTFDRLDQLNSPDSDKFRGVPTGIKELDETITGLNRTDLILLGARPGMGKTSFALNIARHAAVKAGRKSRLFRWKWVANSCARACFPPRRWWAAQSCVPVSSRTTSGCAWWRPATSSQKRRFILTITLPSPSRR